MTHALQLASYLRDHVWAMHRPSLQTAVAHIVAMPASPARLTMVGRVLGGGALAGAGAALDQGAAIPTPAQAAASERPAMADSGVAVIPIHGVITYRPSVWSEYFGGCTVLRVQHLIRGALADPSVRAIVLDIDSPGGTVDGVDELAAEIRAARTVKPLVAVANTFAASAAYWLASAAETIVGLPTSQVGSIGVYTMHEDISQWLDSLGVTVTVIAAGEHKAEALPYAALSEDARAHLQAGVDAAYGLFVAAVAEGRQVAAEVVRGEPFGQGRVYSAKEAKKRGLIDRVGTFDSVIAKLLTTARRPGTRADGAIEDRVAADVAPVADPPPTDDRAAAALAAQAAAASPAPGPDEAQPDQAGASGDADREADVEFRRRRLRLLTV